MGQQDGEGGHILLDLPDGKLLGTTQSGGHQRIRSVTYHRIRLLLLGYLLVVSNGRNGHEHVRQEELVVLRFPGDQFRQTVSSFQRLESGS